jgi:phospholipase D1/2
VTINDSSVVHNKIGTVLYERILQAYRDDETFRVYVMMPLLPAFEGEIGTTTGTSIQAVTHWNYSSICRGGKSLLERLALKVPNPFKYISFFGLRKHTEMCGNLVTELIYVHSKLMIVDDFSVIIASANINDRSMLGNRDSELGIVVQDTNTVDSLMDGKPYKAGAFACSLRKSLFREHLGVSTEDAYCDVTDPISTEFFTNTWLKQASVNTSIYDRVFSCVPTDAVRTLRDLHEYQRRPVLAQTDPSEARQQLRKVKGNIVLLPLQFLCEETLTPAAGTKEALAPTVIWT